jgi:hypothetical protein
LLLARAVGAEQSSRVGNQTGGRVFLFLHTDDFWRDFHIYQSRGVVFVRGPAEENYGTVAVFKDLYGNLWDLVQLKESIPSHQESDVMRDLEPAGILADLKAGFDGDAWHGPPLCKVLDGVNAKTASSRPIPGGHSIWEIVAHLAAWDEVVGERISEQRPIETPDSGDFPLVTDTGAAAWSNALSDLHRQHLRLVEIVSGLDEARLRETVAGKSYSTAHMIRGVLQHMAYHAGQIALIRKVLEVQQ